MTDFTLVDPKGWEYDLHSVYSAYIGYFQVHNIPWFERTWGHLFTSFEDFLAFSWPAITVTDAYTGRAHIVTRLNSVGAFLKMIKTRFGETLPQAPNILQVTPFETTPRHLRKISDYATYKKLYSTLPAAILAAQRTRVRAGAPKAIKELWAKREKTFLALSFVWSERNEKSCLEFGYAAVRCGHMEASGHWPPIPDTNYRKGHFIVEEYVDKVVNKHPPNHPWQYAFGESQLTAKAKLPQIIQATISSLTSPDSETSSNSVVLVGYSMYGQLARLEEMKIKIPHNVLTIDIGNFERSLYSTGERGVMVDPKTGGSRSQGTTLALESLLSSLPLSQSSSTNSGSSSSLNASAKLNTSSNPKDSDPSLHSSKNSSILQCTLSNAGNEAFMSLLALQILLDPSGTRVPSIKKGKLGNPGLGQALSVVNLNRTNSHMNMGWAMGIGAPGGPGTPGVPVSPMPMYGVPSIPVMPCIMPGMGVPGAMGMPTVAVNGRMGPLPPSPIMNGKEVPHVSNNSNPSLREKLYRPSSVHGPVSELGQMQVSMTRAHSSGPLLSPGGHGTDKSRGGGGRRTTSPRVDVDKNERRYSKYPSATLK